MTQLLGLIVLDYKKSIARCMDNLETEESTNVLAQLQGELSSCKLFLESFGNNFTSQLRYESILNESSDMPDFTKMRDRTISKLESQRMQLEDNVDWDLLISALDSLIEQKKDWLFYSAEKGRDLVLAHAWRDALKKHEVLRNDIKREYEFRKEQNELFPDEFSLDGDNSIDIDEMIYREAMDE